MNPGKREEIFRRLRESNPEPRSELEYRTPFELLVAVILSAQATDRSVNIATRELFKHASTPAEILALGTARLEPYVKSIGLYRNKTKNIIETCRLLIAEHGGEVPRSRQALEKLPGVGRKTANVVLNVAFGEPTIAVDTHIFRVANRTAIAPGDDPFEVEQRLLKFVPETYRRNAHHWLILHGRYVCVARKPKCPACIIRELCEYRHKTRDEGGGMAAVRSKDEGGGMRDERSRPRGSGTRDEARASRTRVTNPSAPISGTAGSVRLSKRSNRTR